MSLKDIKTVFCIILFILCVLSLFSMPSYRRAPGYSRTNRVYRRQNPRYGIRRTVRRTVGRRAFRFGRSAYRYGRFFGNLASRFLN